MTPPLDAPTRNALRSYLLALADDELVLGHRDSEWCGHAPILEEDIAFANIALDEIGHASLWYAIFSELGDQDPESYPDRLAFQRSAGDYRCAQMVELPKGDWAFTLLRQFLFDSAEKVRLAWLSHSAYAPVAAAAAKMYKEEIYHYRHTSAWVRRLGLGTDESRRRMGKALDELWPYTRQLFEPVQDEALLFSAGLAPDSADLLAEWDASVGVFLHDCSLTVPDVPRRELTRREHTVHLEQLLAEMQSVARLEPDAAW